MAKIRMGNIVQSWEAHVPGQATEAENFFNEVLREFEIKQTRLSASWENVGGLFGKKARMICIQNGPYGCYIGATTCGIDLHCTWDLYDPRYEKSNDGSFSGLFKSDFNDVINMKAFANTVLDCAQNAVVTIFDKANLDKSKIKRESSGALGRV